MEGLNESPKNDHFVHGSFLHFFSVEGHCAMLKPSEQFHEYLFEVQRSLSAAYKALFIEQGLRTPSDDFGLVMFFLSKDGKITNVRIVSKSTDDADRIIQLALKRLEEKCRIAGMPHFFDKEGIELSFMYGKIVILEDRDPYTGSYADRYKYLDDQLVTTTTKELHSEQRPTVPIDPPKDVSKSVSPPTENEEQILARVALERERLREEMRITQERVLNLLFTDFNDVSLFFDRSVSPTKGLADLCVDFLRERGIQKCELTTKDRLLRIRATNHGPKQYTVRLQFGDSRIVIPDVIDASEVQEVFGTSVEWSKYFDHPPRTREERESFMLTALQDFVDRVNVSRQTGKCPPM